MNINFIIKVSRIFYVIFARTNASAEDAGLEARWTVLVDALALAVQNFLALANFGHTSVRAGRVFALEARTQSGTVVGPEETFVVVCKM